MLTVMECINAKRHGIQERYKAKLIEEIYNTILENASMGKTEGGVSFDYNEDIWIAYCNLREFDYKIKRYTRVDKRFIEDDELLIEYNLEGYNDEQ